MLKAETAEERLKEWKVPDWMERRLAASAALPALLRRIAYAILSRDEDGQEFTGGIQWHKLDETIWQLECGTADERKQVFTALFPALAAQVERGWLLYARLPYQFSSQRKAFRAPHAPELSRSRKILWLRHLVHITADYEQDISWFATWSSYVHGGNTETMGVLLAAAMEADDMEADNMEAGDEEGNRVFDILVASARGEHEIGTMGRQVVRALLIAERPEGWDAVEQLLVAAQRQEGLRQTILETVDEAHPQAFRRILRLLLEHDLVRFSSVTRAVDVWTGFQLDALTPRAVHSVIEQVTTLLDDDTTCRLALAGDDPQTIYLALWSLAFADVDAALTAAAPLLRAETVERRFAAARLLQQLDIPAARIALLPMLEDSDLRVVLHTLKALQSGGNSISQSDCFERLERLLARLPGKEVTLEPLVWAWTGGTLSREAVAGSLRQHLGERPPHRLIPYLPMMDSGGRYNVIHALTHNGAVREYDAETRETLFRLVADPIAWVSETAFKAVAECRLTNEEAVQVESRLARKTPEVRRAALAMLLNQEEGRLLTSMDRLLAASKPEQRLAGLDILLQLRTNDRAPETCRVALERFAANTKKVTDTERRMLENLLNPQEALTRANGLGLFDPAQLTPITPPVMPRNVLFVTDAAVACLKSLLELLHEHRETPISIDTYDGKKEVLLGDSGSSFSAPGLRKPADEELQHLPLREVWETWWRDRPDALRDADGYELLRALGALNGLLYRHYCRQTGYYRPLWTEQEWLKAVVTRLYGHAEADQLPEKINWHVRSVLEWLLFLAPVPAADFLLDTVESTFALVPQEELERKVDANNYRDKEWRDNEVLPGWLRIARRHRALCFAEWQANHHARLWRLLHWYDRPVPTASRHTPLLAETLLAHAAGAATEADLLDMLVGVPNGVRHRGAGYHGLRGISTRKPAPLCVQYPILPGLIERCRRRIIEVETRRGGMPTPASDSAIELQYTGGLDALVQLLSACGADTFDRSNWSSQSSKKAVLSHLVRRTFPRSEDTLQTFAAQIRAGGMTEARLVDLAVFAPQWVEHVAATLGWPGLADGVWWLHAHTKDPQWGVEQEVREEWTAQVSERTPLSAADLLEGAVDVAWFHRVYAALGPERWTALDEAAKYASGGNGHMRARLFADAMLGRLTHAQLMARIKEKRNQDALRALGLAPLAEGTAHEADLLERYRAVQEFLRGSNQFGSQRQASEKLAAAIALQNLARTAGYPDPARLEWAMETAAIADLARGAVKAEVGDVVVSLAINALGQPDLTISKAGKPLKALPVAAKKDPQVLALQERKREIERQATRMRQSLEQAMCRGDQFAAGEVQELLNHPVLAPMLRSLVFLSASESAEEENKSEDKGIVGYPADGGRALERHDGVCAPLAPETPLRIAHPYDLLQTQEWHLWQRDCFLRERVQPFKQVFRELYVLTSAEMTEGHGSRRYEGHQVNPRQSLALLGRCGWVNRPEEGVFRTFHDQNLTAWLTFDQGFTTPAEVEGLTLDGLWFTRKGEGKPLPLTEIPPRVFSEVMRDLDLVVSVAHVGGVDPEASRSTTEMREALLRETCALLKLTNVRYQGQHVLIDGKLGTYSVHLGSAVVHRQPGGHLCIVPVHSQHRGRLFLPFADDDPKTAEVISKVILLAKDAEIKDPTILEQILHAR